MIKKFHFEIKTQKLIKSIKKRFTLSKNFQKHQKAPKFSNQICKNDRKASKIRLSKSTPKIIFKNIQNYESKNDLKFVQISKKRDEKSPKYQYSK